MLSKLAPRHDNETRRPKQHWTSELSFTLVRSFWKKYRACHEKNEAEASEVLHLSKDGYATKVTTVSRNKSFENLKTAVKFTTWDKSPLAAPLILTHACQRFGNVHEMLRARATRMSKCPMSCACHTKRGSDPPKVPNLFAPRKSLTAPTSRQCNTWHAGENAPPQERSKTSFHARLPSKTEDRETSCAVRVTKSAGHGCDHFRSTKP